MNGWLVGGLVAAVAGAAYVAAKPKTSPRSQQVVTIDMGPIPTNVRGGGPTSSFPGTTQYNPDSGYLPGLAPGDKAGSYL